MKSSITTSDKKKLPLAFRLFRGAVPVFETLVPYIANRMAFSAFFYPYRYPIPAKERELANEASTVDFLYRGLKLKGYVWEGNGPTVLFMHGWSSRCTQFIGIINAFRQRGFRCIGFDAPGHGQSVGRWADVIQFGEGIIQFTDLVGKPDYVVAHSMGGAAVIYAAKHGFGAKKCCIMATPTVAEDILEVYRERMNASPKTKQALRDQIIKKYHADFEQFTAAHLAKGTTLPPTLLIYDKDDADVPLANGAVLQAAIPGSELIYTEKLGHTRMLKDQNVVETILNFFAAKQSNE